MAQTPAELRALAAQLAGPHGEHAVAIGEHMNEINLAMVERSIAALAPVASETIVEIGPGNGALSLPILYRLTPGGRYIAIERSAAMAAEVRRLAAGFAAVRSEVRVEECMQAAIAGGSVDGLLAVNVLYFIDDLEALFCRCRQWLRPGGRAVFGVRSVASLRAMPVTAYGFHLRASDVIREALGRNGFTEVDVQYFNGPESGPGARPSMNYRVIRAIAD